MSEHAENLPYWKTGKSPPSIWLDKAAEEVRRAGGTVLALAFGTDGSQKAYMLQFRIGGDMFRVVWPVAKSSKWIHNRGNPKDQWEVAAKRQAATMLYHDVKSSCVKMRVMGARVAFFAHLVLPTGEVAGEMAGDMAQLPSLLTAGD